MTVVTYTLTGVDPHCVYITVVVPFPKWKCHLHKTRHQWQVTSPCYTSKSTNVTTIKKYRVRIVYLILFYFTFPLPTFSLLPHPTPLVIPHYYTAPPPLLPLVVPHSPLSTNPLAQCVDCPHPLPTPLHLGTVLSLTVVNARRRRNETRREHLVYMHVRAYVGNRAN